VHDFYSNKTGIVDVTGRRCFVMSMNRDNVLPPSSMLDLMSKMWGGYYKVNTTVLRNTMRVVTPPITDGAEIGSQYITRECDGLPIYKLENTIKVNKRSVAKQKKQSLFNLLAQIFGSWILSI